MKMKPELAELVERLKKATVTYDPFIDASDYWEDLCGEAAAMLISQAEELSDWQSSQSYRYIGRDGKAVLARELEDRAEKAEAAIVVKPFKSPPGVFDMAELFNAVEIQGETYVPIREYFEVVDKLVAVSAKVNGGGS